MEEIEKLIIEMENYFKQSMKFRAIQIQMEKKLTEKAKKITTEAATE